MSIFSKHLRFTYFPLWLWAVGYAEFMYLTTVDNSLPKGVFTICIGGLLFLATVKNRIFSVLIEAGQVLGEIVSGIKNKNIFSLIFLFCLVCLFLEFALGAFSATRPPHLPQEYDAIHYQMGLPRQLILRGSLEWISWSVADLWPMAMQLGMAPIFLAGETINKLPQFVFAIGVFCCLIQLTKSRWEEKKIGFVLVPAFLFFSAHGVMIQIGTGMMDLPVLYFLLLSCLFLERKQYLFASLALAVFTASKAFHPFQVGMVFLAGLLWLAFRGDLSKARREVLRFSFFLFIFSTAFLFRSGSISFSATGTPLFPFGVCLYDQATICQSEDRAILETSAKELVATRNVYGNGRDISAFLKHLLRVGVPIGGVNNEFDYPLGLPWYLVVFFLLFSLVRRPWRDPFFCLAAMFWLIWWVGSHQSRWLYPFLAFGVLATIKEQVRSHKALISGIAISFLFTLVSQFRSLRPTFPLSSQEIQQLEAQKIKWAPDGTTLQSPELLYLDKPALDHSPGNRQWILR